MAQALEARQALSTLRETHELAGQAVGYLADMATPREGEGPPQMADLVQAVATIAEAQQRVEEKVDRILRLLQPRPA